MSKALVACTVLKPSALRTRLIRRITVTSPMSSSTLIACDDGLPGQPRDGGQRLVTGRHPALPGLGHVDQ